MIIIQVSNVVECTQETSVSNVRINMQPCEMYLEDTMVYRVASVFLTYLPCYDLSTTTEPQPPTARQQQVRAAE